MLGQSLAKAGRSREALEHLQAALDASPGNSRTKITLGETYIDLARYAEALEILLRVDITTLPPPLRSHFHQLLAKIHAGSGDPDEALSELELAAKADPTNPRVQYDFGLAALEAGDTRKSLAALGESLMLAPDYQDAQVAFTKALIEFADQEGSSKETALELAERTATKLVTSWPTYENLMILAQTELLLENVEGVLSAVNRAILTRPAECMPHYIGAQAYLIQEETVKAKSWAQRALEFCESSHDRMKILNLLDEIESR